MATITYLITTYILPVASDPKIEGYGNLFVAVPISFPIVASDPKIEGYGNYLIHCTWRVPPTVASDPKIEGYGNISESSGDDTFECCK